MSGGLRQPVDAGGAARERRRMAARPELPVREEESIPDERTCPDCGKAWVSNGWKDTEIVETRTVTYVRRTEAAAPGLRCRAEKEVVGPALARLFPNTRYGVSVWANVLAERYGLHRPLRSVCRALGQHGLAPGTLADAQRRFLRLAARRRDLPAPVEGADRSRRRNGVDESYERRTEATPGLPGRRTRFAEAFFAAAKKARDALPESAAQRGPLDSLLRHRDGLTTFVDNAAVPMDNNPAERGLRGLAISRKLSFGSQSVDGARLAGMSIFAGRHLAVQLAAMLAPVVRRPKALLTGCRGAPARSASAPGLSPRDRERRPLPLLRARLLRGRAAP